MKRLYKKFRLKWGLIMEKDMIKEWKQKLPEFKEKTAAFYAGELNKMVYKGFSGYYGSYAQKDGKASMLRLRTTAGQIDQEKMKFIADVIRRYHIKRLHFTTCQTIQLHDLGQDTVCSVMEDALDAGIVTIGGGGDFPRNVMCSPLSGVEKNEYFDVLPWAKKAAKYLLTLINQKKMPRKLKVGFSNSPQNITHATYRDLGFTAREDGKFDVYSAGGLGNNPRLGVKVAEKIEPQHILYYIKAMWLTFCEHGNYENRMKARTRYMQESLGGEDSYKEAYLKNLELVRAQEKLDIDIEEKAISKKGDGSLSPQPRVIEQKQPGLYAVVWHPIGGQPDPDAFCQLIDYLQTVEGAQLRLSPDETAYIVNLNANEALKALELTKDSAKTMFETSVSCIGASICQVGLRDSQALLAACVEAVRAANIPDGALPQIHISGCPSSCGTHQTGEIGFRGAVKSIDGKVNPAFVLFVNGREQQGQEKMGQEIGMMLEAAIPDFLVKLGKEVASKQQTFKQWNDANDGALQKIAEEFLV